MKPSHPATWHKGAEARRGQRRGFLAAFSSFAPLTGRLSAHPEMFPGLDGTGWPASSGLDRGRGDCQFSEEDQIQERPTKKMLKTQIAPNILLKTKGRKTENFGLSNIFMKTSSL
jgi:hypothetical protein